MPFLRSENTHPWCLVHRRPVGTSCDETFCDKAGLRNRVAVKIFACLVPFLMVTACTRGSPLPNSVTVRGVVLFRGEPLQQGTIRFAPADGGGQPATGEIRDGSFRMQTTRSSPGIVKGIYKVSIISEKPLIATLPENAPPNPNAWPEPESLIPKKYTDVRTSGLQVSIVEPVDDLRFELTDDPPGS
jgi:hypothetical protein